MHYLTSWGEFCVELHAKTDIARIAMSAISVFKCNLTRNSITSQVMNFP